MTLEEAIACVDLMGWYLDAWRMEDGCVVDYDLRREDHRQKLCESTKDVYIDVRYVKDEDFVRDSCQEPYEWAVKNFIEWVKSDMPVENRDD